MAQFSCFSLFRFMEAAAAHQGATTMVPGARSPTEAPASHARGLSGHWEHSGAAGKTGARRARQEAAAQAEKEEGPGPPCLPLSLLQPPRDPCRSPCQRPTAHPQVPAARALGRGEGAARAAGTASGNCARPPGTPQRRGGCRAVPDARGPQEGCSVELHSQKRAHNPPRPQTEAFHWSVRRDVTERGPFYRQVPGDAIKKSLRGSANQR